MAKDVKDKIIEATIDLIGSCVSIENVKVRDITAKAGVGAGLINYHFQTKENLINQCVQKMIENIIISFEKTYQSLTMEPLDKLRFLTKRTGQFLSGNPGISRISILSDLAAGHCSDNTSQTIKAYLPVIREVCRHGKTDKELYLLTYIFINTLQSAFLRGDVFMQDEEVDFNDTVQREHFIDKLIDILFT